MSLNVKYEHKLQDIAFLGGHHIQYIPHLHRELELICLLEGDVIAYADSVRYELHAGDIFLTFPNQIHSYEKVTHETHVDFISNIFFPSEILCLSLQVIVYYQRLPL